MNLRRPTPKRWFLIILEPHEKLPKYINRWRIGVPIRVYPVREKYWLDSYKEWKYLPWWGAYITKKHITTLHFPDCIKYKLDGVIDI